MKTNPYKSIDSELRQYLQEPAVSYAMSDISLDQVLNDRFLLVKLIQKGIPYSLFKLFKQISPFSESEWAELMDLSSRTLLRHKQVKGFVFRPAQSEKIISLAEVTKLGVEVFGSLESFRLWLFTPSFALGSVAPKDLLKDYYGKELVIKELGRIDHGIFA